MEVRNPLASDIELQATRITGLGKDEVIENFRDDAQKKIDVDVSHLSYSVAVSSRYKTILKDVNFHLPHVSS